MNRAYRAVAGRVLLSADGRAYALKVSNALPAGRVTPLTGRLAVDVDLFPPATLAGKKWDIANREKVLFDALTKCGVWVDDEQIDQIIIVRNGVAPECPDGVVRLTIMQLPA